MKPVLASLVLALTLAACGGGVGGALPSPGTANVTPPTSSTPVQPSGHIAFSSPTFSTPTFNSNTESEAGSCATSIEFTGAQSDFTNEWAQVAVSEQGYSGAFSVTESFGNAPGNAGTSPSQVVAASLAGSTLTLTAIAAGLVYVTVSDSMGHSARCAVGVTTTVATVQSGERRP